MLVEGNAHEFGDEGERTHEGFGKSGKEPVNLLHGWPQRNPLHFIEVKCFEHFVEQTDMSEFFGEMVAADLILDSCGLGKAGNGIPCS